MRRSRKYTMNKRCGKKNAAWTVMIKFTSKLYNFAEEPEPHYAYTGLGPDRASDTLPQEGEEEIPEGNPRTAGLNHFQTHPAS